MRKRGAMLELEEAQWQDVLTAFDDMVEVLQKKVNLLDKSTNQNPNTNKGDAQ